MTNIKNILYVDDELLYRTCFEVGLRNYIAKTNSKLDLADSRESALELIAKNDYDIVFSDGCLTSEGHGDESDENYKGVDVVKAAKLKKIYTVGLSSQPERFLRLAGDNLDINHQKPYDLNTLKYIIEQKPNKNQFEAYLEDKS